MGFWHTAVFTVIGLCACGLGASAQSADLHPDLGKKPPREVLNKDILALPEREQTAWVHGALSQMIVAYAGFDQETSGCLKDWAFLQGNGLEILPGYMEKYPDQPAVVVIHAVAKQACEGV